MDEGALVITSLMQGVIFCDREGKMRGEGEHTNYYCGAPWISIPDQNNQSIEVKIIEI